MSDTFTKDRLQWLDDVAADPRLSGPAFKLAYLISGKVNREKGYAWPGIKRLATSMGMEERNVRRLIEALVSHGFLHKKRGGDGESNQYRMVISDRTNMSDQNESRPDTDVHSEISDRTFLTDRPDISDHQTGHPCPPISLNNSLKELSEKNISVKSLQSDFVREFEELWNIYPRKVSKAAGLKAYMAAKKRSNYETILAGIRRYAVERKGQDPKFTKHLASWLNADCWMDEPAAISPTSPLTGQSASWNSGKDRTREALRIVRGDAA